MIKIVISDCKSVDSRNYRVSGKLFSDSNKVINGKLAFLLGYGGDRMIINKKNGILCHIEFNNSDYEMLLAFLKIESGDLEITDSVPNRDALINFLEGDI